MSSTAFNSSQLMEYKRMAAQKRCDDLLLEIKCLRAQLKQLTMVFETTDDSKLSTVLSIMLHHVKRDIKRSWEHFDTASDERLALAKEFADSIKDVPIFNAGGGYHYGETW